MGLFRRTFELNRLASEPAPRFAVDAESIPPEVFGLVAYTDPIAPAARIDRRSAMQVPAVKRARDLICSTLGALPLELVGPDNRDGSDATFSTLRLLEQPEKNVPQSVTMTRTIEDLLFEGRAWWEITAFGWDGFPAEVKLRRRHQVTYDEDSGKVYVNGRHVPDDRIIRFDSPTDALLVSGARAIRTCLRLESASANAADGAPPVDYFTPAENADPVDDAEVTELLDDWAAARRERSTGYVPAALKYNIAGWSPKDLQMSDARQQAVLEIARCTGIDAEELGVSTTSRTYANQQDRRKAFLDFTLGQYREAIEQRLTMRDVTPRGWSVKFNLSAFLRSDDKTRMETYDIGLRVGAYTKPEIRDLENKPPLTETDTQESPMSITAPEAPASLSLVQGERIAFADPSEPAIRLDSPQDAAAFSVDTEKRVIRGLAVPYGKTGISGGRKFQFGPGTLKFADVRRVKLWVQHDKTKAVGVATKLEDKPDGLHAEFSIARGDEGDKVLALAEDGVLDGLSIGLGLGGRFETRGDVNHAIEAPLMEISLTPAPAFDDARVHAVAADAEGGPAGGGVAFGQDAMAALTKSITAAFALGGREVVSNADLEVNEALPYRFDGVAGEHSFTADLRDSASGDAEARRRLDTFMEEAFAVTTGNTATLNPTQNRPELYVPQLEFKRPLWDLVSTGSINDNTPFTVPKFGTAADLVGDHVEGVEPDPGSFTATNQTINPSPVSGKIEINREVWDQGGSPQADQIIWREMLNAYYEAIEAKIAALLAAVPGAEINLAGAVDEALIDALQAQLIALQYARGGDRFSAFAADGLLYGALVNASDTSGRKLLPIVNPTNAQGSTSAGLAEVQLSNKRIRPAWALGSSAASHSFLFVPSSVYAWASAPKRFTFEYQVKSIDMAIWGYGAYACLRDSDVKKIDYTTADA